MIYEDLDQMMLKQTKHTRADEKLPSMTPDLPNHHRH